MNINYLKRMLPVIALILGLYLIGQLPTAVYATEDNRKIRLELRNRRVTLKVQNMPLGDVLERLAETRGITFIVKDAAEEKLSLELNDVTLEEALKRLLHHKNFAILYDDGGTPSVVYIIGMRAMVRVSPPDEHLRPRAENSGTESETAVSDKMIARVGMVEKELAAAAETESLESSAILQKSLESPLPEVRATALRWAMTSADSARAALAQALMDKHPMVHSAAKQILLERVADQETIKEIQKAVDQDDWASVQAALYRLF
jgi:type II secretory pathway component GspD/PulD (secretin)